MNPLRMWQALTATGLPRARGDEPFRTAPRSSASGAAPARAGMNPMEITKGRVSRGLPRARGDEP